MPTPNRLIQRTKRSAFDAAAVEIGSGVRMHCQEVDADLAIIRFVCAAPPGRPAEAKFGMATGANSGASSGARSGDRRRPRRPSGQS